MPSSPVDEYTPAVSVRVVTPISDTRRFWMMMLLALLMSMPMPLRNAVLPTPMIDLFDLTLILPPLAPFEIVP